MTWIATEGYGLDPAPETLGFVPMLGTPTETRICSPTWLCGGGCPSDALIRSSPEVTVVPRALPSACRRDLLSGNIAILYCA